MTLNDTKLQVEFTELAKALNNQYIMLMIDKMIANSVEEVPELPIEQLVDVKQDIHPSQGGDER